MKTRREFIALLGGAAAAWPLAAVAQQPDRMRRIGILLPATSDDRQFQTCVGAFLQGLGQLGWKIGRNVASTPAGPGPMPPTFADTRRNWPRSRRTSFWPMAPRRVAPLLQATRTVPIVFAIVVDPVGAGFVDTLARPGGNATGFMTVEYSMGGKWLELLKQIAPGVTRVAVLRDASRGSGTSEFAAHPGHGAVAQGGGKSDQHARRRRD